MKEARRVNLAAAVANLAFVGIELWLHPTEWFAYGIVANALLAGVTLSTWYWLRRQEMLLDSIREAATGAEARAAFRAMIDRDFREQITATVAAMKREGLIPDDFDVKVDKVWRH